MKKDWEIKKLGDICDLLNGYAFKSSQYVEKGIRVIRITNVQNGYIVDDEPKFYPNDKENLLKDYMLSAGDLLISLTGNCGRVGILTEDFLPAALNQRVSCLRIKDNSVLKSFLFHLLNNKAFENKCMDEATGAAQKNMSTEWLKKQEFSIPPLEEQKRIVKILDEKFAQLESLKAASQTNLQNVKDLFQSQLTKAFSNTTWEKKRLGDCGTFKNGMNFAATDSGYTIRSLGVGDFKDRYSIDDTETLSEISLKAAPSEDYLLHDGDIVFVRSNGNKELVGRCLLVYPKNVPTTYSGFCIRFRKDFDLLDADFLLHFMKAESSRKILNGKEGANISNLNQKILGDFEVPLPLLPEQKLIVKELDALSEKVRQLQEIYTKQIANCDELKQALLQKAFEGEF